MRVKVITKFRDKRTKAMMRPGMEMEITRERFEEIVSVGDFVREIAVSASSCDGVDISSDEIENAPEAASASSGDALDEMTVKQLRVYASERHKLTFPAGMKKSEIIDEIRRMEK